MLLLKLTKVDDGSSPRFPREIWVNMDRVYVIFSASSKDESVGGHFTRLSMGGDEYWDVVELPEDIAKMCKVF